jgi:hypothetical protein
MENETYVVNLLSPVPDELRDALALELSQRFKVAPDKMQRRLNQVGTITKPLSKATADTVAALLLESGAEAVVARDNLSEVLLFEEEEDSVLHDQQDLRELLANLPAAIVPATFTPVNAKPPGIKMRFDKQPTSKLNQSVAVGIYSLLFLILMVTFGISFARPEQSPLPIFAASQQSQTQQNQIQRHIMVPIVMVSIQR